ncbi:hypothetical protein QJQ45_029658 [Haematococcus lacustris]|nr:hypothetical protein QJQ45_029658 [Haematococcus lacustris]
MAELRAATALPTSPSAHPYACPSPAGGPQLLHAPQAAPLALAPREEQPAHERAQRGAGAALQFLLLFKPCTSSRLTPADVHIAFHRTHDQFLFALTLIADKLGVPVRMTRAAKEPRKTESAGQPGGDLLARVKHVFAFYALCGGGTDETRLGRAEWRQWLRDAGLVSDAGPPAGLPGAALDGLFRRALLPGEPLSLLLQRGLTLAEFLDAVQPVALALRVSAQQVQQRLVAGGAPALLDHDQLLFLQLAASSTAQQQGQKGQGRVGGGHGGSAWRLIWGWGPWALLDKITASMGKHGH